jgi:hypothetical protein
VFLFFDLVECIQGMLRSVFVIFSVLVSVSLFVVSRCVETGSWMDVVVKF